MKKLLMLVFAMMVMTSLAYAQHGGHGGGGCDPDSGYHGGGGCDPDSGNGGGCDPDSGWQHGDYGDCERPDSMPHYGGGGHGGDTCFVHQRNRFHMEICPDSCWHGDGDCEPDSGGWQHGDGDCEPDSGGWQHGDGGGCDPDSGGHHGGGGGHHGDTTFVFNPGQNQLQVSNYPNPFNPEATISFELKQEQHVTVTVYDLLGREVEVLANRTFPAGTNKVTFRGSQDGSAVYLYRIEAGSERASGKMIFLK